MECAWLYPDGVAWTIQKNDTIPRSGPTRIGYDLVRIEELWSGADGRVLSFVSSQLIY